MAKIETMPNKPPIPGNGLFTPPIKPGDDFSEGLFSIVLPTCFSRDSHPEVDKNYGDLRICRTFFSEECLNTFRIRSTPGWR